MWDNIEVLQHSLEDDGREAQHVFLLSGWVAPGIDLAFDPTENIDGRRLWTCWCAIHRMASPDPLAKSTEAPGLIIMEFEWEKDTLNPLYPSALPPWRASLLPEAISPSSSTSQPAHVSPVIGSNPHPFAGLAGEDDWLPSQQDIAESTTNYAKSLPALQRLRRTNETNFPSDESSSPPQTKPQRRRRRTSNDGMGMMDVFAVMTQINEQIGAVTSLDHFLKVVVGILKDLTQFHRVLVYQFDEAWNGQVVAELVDWGQTRDLYRGLHFPASDIPAQVRVIH